MQQQHQKIIIDSLEGFQISRFRSYEIDIPSFAFTPNYTSAAFLRGLLKINPSLSGFGLEVGVGTGLLAAELLSQCPGIRTIYGSDIVPDLSYVAEYNIRNLLEEQVRHGEPPFIPCPGSRSLIDWFPKEYPNTKLDFIYASIPQRKIYSSSDSISEKELGVNYIAHDKESSWDIYELGLNAKLLKQAQEILPTKSKIILNLSGKPSLEILEKLFRSHGWTPNVLATEMICYNYTRQYLEYLAEVEKLHKISFYLFDYLESEVTTDSEANSKSASEILEGYNEERNIYHFNYVIEGRR